MCKITKADAEKLAARQFYAGFLLLPWLWVANCLYFWDIRKHNAVVDRYCTLSLRCFLGACVAALIYWTVLYTAFPNSSLWIIKPGVDEYQEGLFTKSLLN